MRSSSPPPPSYFDESADLPQTSDEGFSPSAPLFDLDENLNSQLSYDQVVIWWNTLPDAKGSAMQSACNKALSSADLATLRRDFQSYYPQEYFPKKIYSKDELSASDYYVLFNYRDQLVAKYDWYQALSTAFAPLEPPSYASVKAQQQEAPPPSYAEATQWWENLSSEQRQKMETESAKLDFEKRSQVRARFVSYNYYPQYYPLYRYEFCPYDYYLMHRYPSYLDDFLWFETIRASFELGGLLARGTFNAVRYGVPYLGHAAVHATQAVGSFFGNMIQFFGMTGNNLLSSGDHHTQGDKNSNGVIAVIVGILALIAAAMAAASAVVASLYGIIKGSTAVSNIFLHRKKILPSLLRLASMAGGAWLGAVEGMAVGAIVGSAVPGIGTAAGAIVGAIFGAPITAALFAAATKYTLQLISQLKPRVDEEVLSVTNPDKWSVTQAKAKLEEKGVTLTPMHVKDILLAVRNEKNALNSLASANPFSKKHHEREGYNHLRDAIFSGKDPRQLIRVDAHTCFIWNEKQRKLERTQCELPELKRGLKM